MRNLSIIFLIIFFTTNLCFGQEEEETRAPTPTDSVKTDLKDKGIIIENDELFEKKEINPLAPSKAAFLSSLVPGLGQIYNKRYWKVPIVYGAIGGSIYAYTWNNDSYQRFRTAFKRRQAGFIDDEFYDIRGDNEIGQGPDLDIDDLENQQERFQRDRDLWLVVAIAMYALNIVDANVDAHLKQFNIDDDLSIDFQPYFEFNEINNTPNYGMGLTFKF